MLFHGKSRYIVETLGSPSLRRPAAPVAEVTDEIRALAEKMTATMRAFDGIGIAGPQVGAPYRIVVLGIPPEALGEIPTPGELLLLPRMPLVILNPEITGQSAELAERDEGCLSFPEIYAPVTRPARVTLKAATLDGEIIHCECGNLLGRCIQHELDHLDGRVFIDRVAPDDLRLIAPELKKLEKYGAKHHFHRTAVR